MLREQLERRKIELGVGKDITIPIVIDEGIVDKKKVKEIIPDIQLIDFASEEEREYEPIISFIKKYKKLLRYLFTKYANTCYYKKIMEFDALKQKAKVITLNEITKMIKEHQVNSTMLNRDELITMIRLVSIKNNSPDVSSLTFEAFQDFFLQMAIYIYSKQSGLSHLPLVESVKALVKHFEKATEGRGENTLLYTDPETTVLGDQDLLKELNKVIKANPDYPLPEGYRRVIDKQPNFLYTISHSLKRVIGEPKTIIIEILDEIICRAIPGIHIIESIVRYEIKAKVYPDIVKPMKQNLPSRYMDLLNKKVKVKSLEAVSTVPLIRKAMIEPEKKIPANMKLIVLGMPKDLQPIAKEVAIALDEVIEAITEGRHSLEKKHVNLNRVLRNREGYNEALRRNEREKEQRRRSRHHMLKNKINAIKRKEVEDAENNKERKEENMKREKERLEKEKMERLRERDEAKRRLQEAKEKKQEEKKRLEQEEQRKQKEEGETKARIREDFLRRKKEEMVIPINN